MYLNEPWNVLDFVVVVSMWVNLIVETTGLEVRGPACTRLRREITQ
jgi:hypothetical protein